MKKTHTTIAMLACLAMVSLGIALAQAPEHPEHALKNPAAHDHVDPDYARLMGQHSAAGPTGTLLKVNHASEKQIDAYDNFFKENDERHLNELKELVAIPSLAMAPEHAPDVLKAAEWLKKKLDDIGMKNAAIHETDGYRSRKRRCAVENATQRRRDIRAWLRS